MIIFVLWLIYCNDFVCKFQKYLAILILETFINYINKKKKKKKMKDGPSFYYHVYWRWVSLQLWVFNTPFNSNNTPQLVFFWVSPVNVFIQVPISSFFIMINRAFLVFSIFFVNILCLLFEEKMTLLCIVMT